MSKLIESLKGQQDVSEKKTEYQLTQEQLASIYFSGTDKQSKNTNPPLVIKVIERPALYKAIPWIIATLAMLLAAFSLFSTKRIFVDIHVADDDAIVSKDTKKQN